jgi:hypothetical protein
MQNNFETVEANFQHLRLKLAIRKAMLRRAEREEYRVVLRRAFPWASTAVFDKVIADCVAEGTITEKKGGYGGVIYAWHEEGQ